MSSFEMHHSLHPSPARLPGGHSVSEFRPIAAGEAFRRDDPNDGVRPVALAIAGPTGMVGSALLHLLEEKREWLQKECGLNLPVVGAINTRGMVWNDEGIPADAVAGCVLSGPAPRWEFFAGKVAAHRETPLLFLDCTASPVVARLYLSFLASGVGIVTPNKIANTMDYTYYDALRHLARGSSYRYETTVGAATPMIRTITDLRQTGDAVSRIEGVLSGTLSYVFRRLDEGTAFSAAVREAAERGLTEPDPATDLTGEDVARKLLILVREAGMRLERRDITVERLIPPALALSGNPRDFLDRLSVCDTAWNERTHAARGRGNVLTYAARFDGMAATVGVVEIGRDETFAHLKPSENAVRYFTERHSPLPLTIQGIGAGPDVTARGVFADVVQAARDMYECCRSC